MLPTQRSCAGGLWIFLTLWGLISASDTLPSYPSPKYVTRLTEDNTTRINITSINTTMPYDGNVTSQLDLMLEALEEVREAVDDLQRLVNSHLATSTTATPTFQSFFKPHHPEGVLYVRWGRRSCPPGTELVYRGNAGAGHHSDKGAPPNPLCLPLDPIYANFTPNYNGTNYLYGMEYYSFNNLPNFDNHGQDVPCAVCLNPRRSLVFMLPARTACVPGWSVEYLGYLMAGRHDNAASVEYICVDHQPENVDGGQGSQGYGHLYFVKTSCTTSLRCPPYKSGQEVTCAVCSK